jgi:hypothetical protein
MCTTHVTPGGQHPRSICALTHVSGAQAQHRLPSPLLLVCCSLVKRWGPLAVAAVVLVPLVPHAAVVSAVVAAPCCCCRVIQVARGRCRVTRRKECRHHGGAAAAAARCARVGAHVVIVTHIRSKVNGGGARLSACSCTASSRRVSIHG